MMPQRILPQSAPPFSSTSFKSRRLACARIWKYFDSATPSWTSNYRTTQASHHHRARRHKDESHRLGQSESSGPGIFHCLDEPRSIPSSGQGTVQRNHVRSGSRRRRHLGDRAHEREHCQVEQHCHSAPAAPRIQCMPRLAEKKRRCLLC